MRQARELDLDHPISCATRDRIDEQPRDFLFRILRPILDPVGGHKMDAVAVAAHDVAGNVVGDDPVGAFADLLGDGVVDDAVGFRREADDEARAAARATQISARMSRVGTKFSSGGPSPFLSLVGEISTRQSATAATMIAQSAGRAAMTASAICSAVSTSTRSTPAGVSSDTGPATRVTRAPTSAAAAAMAKP